ncbi:ras-related protein Rab-26-like isoform X2 [Carassius gibelio]|uniref:ras-related protein Rab-26-like isoform X2 n=1 Tax=Carassius gibelio TaxID=101364 RepID=UPI002277A4DB|nr:ras-related protein Rab-26-like isoform X2 [Carassius gibelio]
MLVGDSGVGKTCLLVRFKDGAFLAGSFISTVGIDFRNKVLSIDGVRVKLQIWDTAGQERFRSVTHAYYRDAHALLLLYDVTNKASFDNIQRHAEHARLTESVTLYGPAVAQQLKDDLWDVFLVSLPRARSLTAVYNDYSSVCDTQQLFLLVDRLSIYL